MRSQLQWWTKQVFNWTFFCKQPAKNLSWVTRRVIPTQLVHTWPIGQFHWQPKRVFTCGHAVAQESKTTGWGKCEEGSPIKPVQTPTTHFIDDQSKFSLADFLLLKNPEVKQKAEENCPQTAGWQAKQFLSCRLSAPVSPTPWPHLVKCELSVYHLVSWLPQQFTPGTIYIQKFSHGQAEYWRPAWRKRASKSWKYIKTYWPAGGGRGQNPENTAQGNSGQNAIRP